MLQLATKITLFYRVTKAYPCVSFILLLSSILPGRCACFQCVLNYVILHDSSHVIEAAFVIRHGTSHALTAVTCSEFYSVLFLCCYPVRPFPFLHQVRCQCLYPFFSGWLPEHTIRLLFLPGDVKHILTCKNTKKIVF